MFKNWERICKIEDTHFMWAMALLDLASEFGRNVASRFPEYFLEKQDEQQKYPIPLSVIRKASEREIKESRSDNIDALVSFCKYWDFDIPIISFSTEEDNGFDDPMLPREVREQVGKLCRRAVPGDIFIWEKKKNCTS